MSRTEKIKIFLQRYKHIWVFSYAFIYLPWFFLLERKVTTHFYVIHSRIDDKIPFIEYFIIPYLLWFAMIAVVVLYFFFTDTAGFYRLCALLISGMTIFLIISTVFPNGLDLRPTTFARDNVFVDMVKILYAADTPTNVLPSIHVYNSIGVCIAVFHSEAFRRSRIASRTIYILSVLIILATMFLKQHSIIDVTAAFILIYPLYLFIYQPVSKKYAKLSRQPI